MEKEKEKSYAMLWKGIKFTFAFTWKYYKKRFIILCILALITAILGAFFPLISAMIIDEIIIISQTKSIGNYFWKLAIGWGMLSIAIIIFETIRSFINEQFDDQLFQKFCRMSWSHLIHLPLGFHKNKNSGEVIEMFHRASDAMSQIVSNTFINLGPQILTIFLSLGILFYLHIPTALFVTIGLIIYIWIMARITRTSADLVTQIRKGTRKNFDLFHDSMGSIREVKIATYENKLFNLFGDFFKGTFDLIKKRVTLTQRSYLFARLTVRGIQAGVYGLAVYFILQGEMTIGVLLAFNGYAAQIYGPFFQLSDMWRWIEVTGINMGQFSEILALEPEPNKITPIKPDGIINKVSFQNVSFSYPENDKDTLRNISLDIPTGSVVALVGKSGVGKTTCIDMIPALHYPTDGKILIDGIATTDWNLHELRSQIGYVSQEIILLNDTIKANILFANPDADDAHIEKACRDAHIFDFIQGLEKGFDTLVGDRGVKLSVGQKQRIAIARAILRNPEILILDEPTSALDAQTEHDITQSLDALMQGKTTFIIAHRLSTVRRADIIIVFKDGTIVERGTHDELLQLNGEYAQLHQLQTQSAMFV